MKETNPEFTLKPIMNDLRCCFGQLEPQWQPVFVLPELTQKTAERTGGAIHLIYQRYTHADGHDARFVRLSGPKVEVQTLFIYPASCSPLPVFAAETVVIGGKPQVLVLDMPVVASSGGQQHAVVKAAMQAISSKFGLVSDAEIPHWYQECRSGHDIFLRQPDASTALAFHEFALQATLKWRDLAATWLPVPDSSFHAKAIFDYKQHHQQFSPGIPLMSRCFGEQWTGQFMTEFFN